LKKAIQHWPSYASDVCGLQWKLNRSYKTAVIRRTPSRERRIHSRYPITGGWLVDYGPSERKYRTNAHQNERWKNIVFVTLTTTLLHYYNRKTSSLIREVCW